MVNEASQYFSDPDGSVSYRRNTRLLIDGCWVEAQSGKTFPIINPANKTVLAMVAEGGEEDIDRAVHAARSAFETGPWARMSSAERGALMYRLADLIEKYSGELAYLETIDCGKPLAETTSTDVPSAIECFRFFAGVSDKVYGDTIPVHPDYFTFTLREPIGVIGQIIPWNFPLLLASWKLAPALAMGNTVVLKPAEETALTAIRLGELILEAGFPPGVVNIVTGFGEVAGRALSNHPDVDKVAFTGSTAVGREIVKASAGNLKKLSLELGGKGPNIIFADADIDAAIKGTMKGAFYNQGQMCCAGSRLFVAREIHAEVTHKLLQQVKRITLGDPLHPGTTMGPVISERHYNRIMGYLRQGMCEGASVLHGGEGAGDPGLEEGFFVRPTVFGDVVNSMIIARDEIFGPVVSVIGFDDEPEVVRLANDTVYGLSAGVWTSNLKRAHRMANALKAGSVWINCFNKANPAMPFGGYKNSGYGRDQGVYAAEMYTQNKSVWVNLK